MKLQAVYFEINQLKLLSAPGPRLEVLCGTPREILKVPEYFFLTEPSPDANTNALRETNQPQHQTETLQDGEEVFARC